MVLSLSEDKSTDLVSVGSVPCLRFGLEKKKKTSCPEQNALSLYQPLSAG